MKIVGLVVEYNPFHNGHLYHIEEALRITGADKVIVVMSGDFVQRGAPALMPKHLRTKMALQCGASLVIELPIRYATGSAEFFATGAIDLLNQLGCIDSICFGSESGDIEALTMVANTLIAEPESFRLSLQSYLKSGLSFPLARQKAMEDYAHSNHWTTEISTILSEPNNILGVEYIKALQHLKSPINPFTISRKGSHYHENQLNTTSSSATAIRQEFLTLASNTCTTTEILPSIKEQVPLPCFLIMKDNYLKRYPIYWDDFSLLLHNKLLLETAETLMQYEDMTIELANRILNNRNDFLSCSQFIQRINSKNLTHARISRVLLHVLLNIYNYSSLNDNIDVVKNHYIHILGFQKSDSHLFTLIKEASDLPIVTKLTNPPLLNQVGGEMMQEDFYASNLYESVVTHKLKTNFIHEYEKSLILL